MQIRQRFVIVRIGQHPGHKHYYLHLEKTWDARISNATAFEKYGDAEEEIENLTQGGIYQIEKIFILDDTK